MRKPGQLPASQKSNSDDSNLLNEEEINKKALVETYIALASQMIESKEYQNALVVLSDAIKNDPTNPKILFMQAEAYYLLGNLEKADIGFHFFLKMDKKRVMKKERAKALTCLANIQQTSHAVVSYMVADLQFTEAGEVKILELGRGMQSGVEGYHRLHQDNEAVFYDKFVGNILGLNPSWDSADKVCFTSLPGMNIFHSENFAKFSEIMKTQPSVPAKCRGNLPSYHGVVFSGSQAPKLLDNVILADGSVPFHLLAENKQLMHEAVPKSAEQFRPRCAIFPMKYTLNLSKEIHQLISCDYYVLKTPDGTRGQGNRITSKKNLNQSLKIFFKKEASKSSCSYFLVEEYVPSKIVTVNQEHYRGTIRALFFICRDAEKLYFKPIGLYWKLPQQCITGDNLRVRTITSFSAEHLRSAQVDEQDQSIVWRQLETAMLAMFDVSLKKDYLAEAIACLHSKITLEQDHGFYLLTHLANIYAQLSQFELAEHCLSHTKKAKPKHYRSYHEHGILLHQQGKYSEAILQFDRALALSPQPSTYYRRALSYIKNGNFKLARIALENLLHLYPGNPQYLSALNLMKFEQNFQKPQQDSKALLRITMNELQRLAIGRLNEGDHTSAMTLLSQCRAAYERLKDWDMLSKMLANMGVCYFQQEQYQPAVEAFQKALEVMRTHELDNTKRRQTLQSNLTRAQESLQSKSVGSALLLDNK